MISRIPLKNVITHKDVVNTECPGKNFIIKGVLENIKNIEDNKLTL